VLGLPVLDVSGPGLMGGMRDRVFGLWRRDATEQGGDRRAQREGPRPGHCEQQQAPAEHGRLFAAVDDRKNTGGLVHGEVCVSHRPGSQDGGGPRQHAPTGDMPYVAAVTCTWTDGYQPTPAGVALIELAGRCAASAVRHTQQAELLQASRP